MSIKTLYKRSMTLLTRVSPELTSRIIYLRIMKKPLHLRNPRLFSEKLMKLKLSNYLGNRTVWQCADKYTVREYLLSRGIQPNNLPRLIGVYSRASEIDFDILPQKFVLKCTHGSGFNIICKNKKDIDRMAAMEDLDRWLRTPYGLDTAETHYGRVQPLIICEAFIEGGGEMTCRMTIKYIALGACRSILWYVQNELVSDLRLTSLISTGKTRDI